MVGGYIAGSAALCDFVRSFASGFIFTTALPPAVAAGALASVRHLKSSSVERERQQERVATVRRRLDRRRGAASHESEPHRAGDGGRRPSVQAGSATCLLEHYGIYVQPINYPTVPRGTERLRITPSPLHSDADIDRLIAALSAIWSEFSLRRAA